MVSVELGELATHVEAPYFEFVVIAFSTAITAFSFFYPTYFSRRQNMGRGLSELIRIFEADDSWRARRILILKYEKNLEPSEMDEFCHIDFSNLEARSKTLTREYMGIIEQGLGYANGVKT